MGDSGSAIQSKTKKMSSKWYRLQNDIQDYFKNKVESDEWQSIISHLQDDVTLPSEYLKLRDNER